MDISIIIPMYNEEECVRPLYDSILDAISPLGIEFEIIIVDDGSSDDTFEIGKTLARNDSRLRLIKFRKNYGQTAAMSAGIDYARGKVLVTMDGDLQNDPEDIPKFIDKIEEGFDIVCGWRYMRSDKLITRIIPSKIANWMIGKITGVPIKDNGCSLKAYRAKIIRHVPLYSDMHRFIPAMASLAGTRVAELTVKHHPRKFGKSKYGLSRVYKVLIDLLVIKTLISFTERPLRLFASGGLISMLVGFVMLISSFAGLFSTRGEFGFMIASGALLFFVLAFFLALIGMLCEHTFNTGDFRELSHLKRKMQ